MKVVAIGKGVIMKVVSEYLAIHLTEFKTLGICDKLPHKKDCDLLICLSYPKTLKRRDLKRYKYGCINLHTSLLPKYRGRHPLRWAMVKGEKELGVTVHYMNDSIDTGDIILQDSIVNDSSLMYEEALSKLLEKGKEMVLKAVMQIATGTVYRRKQLEQFSSYYPRRTEKDNVIVASQKAFNKIKALDGLPLAFQCSESKGLWRYL